MTVDGMRKGTQKAHVTRKKKNRRGTGGKGLELAPLSGSPEQHVQGNMVQKIEKKLESRNRRWKQKLVP